MRLAEWNISRSKRTPRVALLRGKVGRAGYSQVTQRSQEANFRRDRARHGVAPEIPAVVHSTAPATSSSPRQTAGRGRCGSCAFVRCDCTTLVGAKIEHPRAPVPEWAGGDRTAGWALRSDWPEPKERTTRYTSIIPSDAILASNEVKGQARGLIWILTLW